MLWRKHACSPLAQVQLELVATFNHTGLLSPFDVTGEEVAAFISRECPPADATDLAAVFPGRALMTSSATRRLTSLTCDLGGEEVGAARRGVAPSRGVMSSATT